jgi:hypothetical protein
MVGRGTRWRAPKRSNDAAWQRIEQGDWLWDHRAVDADTGRRREQWEWRMARILPRRRRGRIQPRWRGLGWQRDEVTFPDKEAGR